MDSSKQLVPLGATAAPADNQLAPRTANSQARIRTNIVFLQPLRFYVPDDDASVPYALMMGRHAVENAGGCRGALLSGYLSILCAVLPDLTYIAKKITENQGFQVEEIRVPSQAERMGTVIPQSQDLLLEIIKFAQLLFLPFQVRFDGEVRGMWQGLARDVGLGDVSSVMVCSMDDMKTISTALVASGLDGALQRSIASSLQKLTATGSSFGHITSQAKERGGHIFAYTLYSGFDSVSLCRGTLMS